ncbi:hypothetical protein PL373_03715 [Tenacibaculum maritimum]|nr:hypothetical protein [Tenacibaculum maritimum]MDB0600261.1 hypothetical protein [Tenacibaculum maritimum]MDB0610771.1 hypothetical protein [Tenacibaculum maritimum]
MNTSLLKEFRFKIGEQYELNEFNLKTLESTFINGIEFENYEYIEDDFKTLFGVKLLNNVILQYNGDILCGVIYEFDMKHYSYLISKINECSFIDVILEVLVKNETHCQIVLRSK